MRQSQGLDVTDENEGGKEGRREGGGEGGARPRVGMVVESDEELVRVQHVSYLPGL